MVLNRLKLISALAVNARRCFSTSKQMNSAHGVLWYRTPKPKPLDKKTYYAGLFLSSYMWWWVFWHMWTDYEHITGEFPYPNPEVWTDEELGIPPDK